MRSFLTCVLCVSLSAPALADKPWDYTRARGEREWGALSENFAACDIGTKQSPIDMLPGTPRSSMLPLRFEYKAGKADIDFKDFALRIHPRETNRLIDHNDTYQLDEIRIHTPSEHTLQGRVFPLELQFMHRDAGGKRLIVSVFAMMKKPNDALASVMAVLPDQEKKSEAAVDITQFLPDKPGYFAYTGSLTYPPCTEDVEWRIMKYAILVSTEQVQALSMAMKRNARGPQDIKNRNVRQTIF